MTEPDECRICHRSVCIEDGYEDDGSKCCWTCRITELEEQLETIERTFTEGKRAAEEYYEQGQNGNDRTPYTDELRQHWWTRGFAYTARLHRAINAEIELHEWRNKRDHGVCNEELMAEVSRRVEVENERDALKLKLEKMVPAINKARMHFHVSRCAPYQTICRFDGEPTGKWTMLVGSVALKQLPLDNYIIIQVRMLVDEAPALPVGCKFQLVEGECVIADGEIIS